MAERFFILSGGPGSGKTSLANALAAQGLPVMEESGRAVIRRNRSTGGDALPWINPIAFSYAMLIWDIERYRIAEKFSGPVIFDRGLPDILGYLKVEGLAVPAAIENAVRGHDYNPTVFIAPHWDEIFCHDDERRQDRAKAKATCDAMIHVYRSLGYKPIPLPKASIAQRVRFVRAAL